MAENSTVSVLGSIGPWVVSGLALIQVWLIEAYRKYRKPVIEIFETGKIEVGFSQFGLTMALMGTMRVRYRDTFVKGMSVEVIRDRDNARHTFSWHTFRENAIVLGPEVPVKFEIAGGFLLIPSNPFRHNIFFVDNDFISDMAPTLGSVVKKWFDYRLERLQELDQMAPQERNAAISNPLLPQVFFNDFVKSGQITDAFSALERDCYWTPGGYHLRLNIETSDSKETITRLHKFTLTNDDAAGLRNNSIAILRSLCDLNANFYFAYPQYESAE